MASSAAALLWLPALLLLTALPSSDATTCYQVSTPGTPFTSGLYFPLGDGALVNGAPQFLLARSANVVLARHVSATGDSFAWRITTRTPSITQGYPQGATLYTFWARADSATEPTTVPTANFSPVQPATGSFSVTPVTCPTSIAAATSVLPECLFVSTGRSSAQGNREFDLTGLYRLREADGSGGASYAAAALFSKEEMQPEALVPDAKLGAFELREIPAGNVGDYGKPLWVALYNTNPIADFAASEDRWYYAARTLSAAAGSVPIGYSAFVSTSDANAVAQRTSKPLIGGEPVVVLVAPSCDVESLPFPKEIEVAWDARADLAGAYVFTGWSQGAPFYKTPNGGVIKRVSEGPQWFWEIYDAGNAPVARSEQTFGINPLEFGVSDVQLRWGFTDGPIVRPGAPAASRARTQANFEPACGAAGVACAWDAQCRDKLADCACINGFAKCDSAKPLGALPGHCAADPSLCDHDCQNPMIRCWDHQCVNKVSECSCPPGYPVDCAPISGSVTCATKQEQCTGYVAPTATTAAAAPVTTEAPATTARATTAAPATTAAAATTAVPPVSTSGSSSPAPTGVPTTPLPAALSGACGSVAHIFAPSSSGDDISAVQSMLLFSSRSVKQFSLANNEVPPASVLASYEAVVYWCAKAPQSEATRTSISNVLAEFLGRGATVIMLGNSFADPLCLPTGDFASRGYTVAGAGGVVDQTLAGALGDVLDHTALAGVALDDVRVSGAVAMSQVSALATVVARFENGLPYVLVRPPRAAEGAVVLVNWFPFGAEAGAAPPTQRRAVGEQVRAEELVFFNVMNFACTAGSQARELRSSVNQLRAFLSPESPLQKDIRNDLELEIAFTRLVDGFPTKRRTVFSINPRLTLSEVLEGYAEDTTISASIRTTAGSVLVTRSLAQPVKTAIPMLYDFSWTLLESELVKLLPALNGGAGGDFQETIVRVQRKAGLLAVPNSRVDYRSLQFSVAPVWADNVDAQLSLRSFFGTVGGRLATTSSITKVTAQTKVEDLTFVRHLTFSRVQPALDGAFDFSVARRGAAALLNQDSFIGWTWMIITDSSVISGYVDDVHNIDAADLGARVVVVFPLDESLRFAAEPGATAKAFFSKSSQALYPTESELLSNVAEFTEEPGESCDPFSKPTRIVGERAFFSMHRVTQPQLGSLGLSGAVDDAVDETVAGVDFDVRDFVDSAFQLGGVGTSTKKQLSSPEKRIVRKWKPQQVTKLLSPEATAALPTTKSTAKSPLLDLDDLDAAAEVVVPRPVALEEEEQHSAKGADLLQDRATEEQAYTNPTKGGDSALDPAPTARTPVLVSGTKIAAVVSSGFKLKTIVDSLSQRAEVSVDNPIPWDDDPVDLFQASSVSGGVILEYRVRWRSFGYSLGDVRSTMTLLPRQKIAIAKVDWERHQREQRDEFQQEFAQLQQDTARQMQFLTQVSANMHEWNVGTSTTASASANAGGSFFGLFGGGTSVAGSASFAAQYGGRALSGSEQQNLQDSLRQYAQSLRQQQSKVVVAADEDEVAAGRAETLMNVNYCHTLTVMYHQILRHYRVSTEVVGAREVLYVPFKVSDFTLAKLAKHQQIVERYLLDSRHLPAFPHIEDVAANFANSLLPTAPRSQLPIRYMRGTISVRMRLARPSDSSIGEFVESNWSPFAGLLPSPARAIWGSLGFPGFNANHVLTPNLVDRLMAERDRLFDKEVAPKLARNWAAKLIVRSGSASAATPLDGVDLTIASAYRYGAIMRVHFMWVPRGDELTREDLTYVDVLGGAELPPGSQAELVGFQATYETEYFSRAVSWSRGPTMDLVDAETGAIEPTGASMYFPLTQYERVNPRTDAQARVTRLLEHVNKKQLHYHKNIWWNMDRDSLFMLLDGFTAAIAQGRSLASILEPRPFGIVGNSLAFRVVAGVFLGIGGHADADALNNYYVGVRTEAEPMFVSTPTDGLYARTLMDPCDTCEEHDGDTDWVLQTEEPALPSDKIDLASRSEKSGALTPTKLAEAIFTLPTVEIGKPGLSKLDKLIEALSRGFPNLAQHANLSVLNLDFGLVLGTPEPSGAGLLDRAAAADREDAAEDELFLGSAEERARLERASARAARSSSSRKQQQRGGSAFAQLLSSDATGANATHLSDDAITRIVLAKVIKEIMGEVINATQDASRLAAGNGLISSMLAANLAGDGAATASESDSSGVSFGDSPEAALKYAAMLEERLSSRVATEMVQTVQRTRQKGLISDQQARGYVKSIMDSFVQPKEDKKSNLASIVEAVAQRAVDAGTLRYLRVTDQDGTVHLSANEGEPPAAPTPVPTPSTTPPATGTNAGTTAAPAGTSAAAAASTTAAGAPSTSAAVVGTTGAAVGTTAAAAGTTAAAAGSTGAAATTPAAPPASTANPAVSSPFLLECPTTTAVLSAAPRLGTFQASVAAALLPVAAFVLLAQ